MVVGEALARGLPVVSCPTGAIAGLVTPKRGGARIARQRGRTRKRSEDVIGNRDVRLRLAAGARQVRDRLPTWDTLVEWPRRSSEQDVRERFSGDGSPCVSRPIGIALGAGDQRGRDALPKGRVVRAVDLAAGTGSKRAFSGAVLPASRMAARRPRSGSSRARARAIGSDIRTHAMDLSRRESSPRASGPGLCDRVSAARFGVGGLAAGRVRCAGVSGRLCYLRCRMTDG